MDSQELKLHLIPHEREVLEGKRFPFGKNWLQFLQVVNEERIAEAERSLVEALGVRDLKGKRFLDIGCGSGLFSLAARRLGARVHSFDYDPQSVVCAVELKRRYYLQDPDWTIEEASVLDEGYLRSLGVFDVVYSWGVLHHTGAMWQALKNCTTVVADNGKLYIAIYNAQPFWSSYWRFVKRLYNHSPSSIRNIIVLVFYSYFLIGSFIVDVLRGRNPFDRHRGRGQRGMSMYRDVIDWIGGWPFEVATPGEVI